LESVPMSQRPVGRTCKPNHLPLVLATRGSSRLNLYMIWL
jgi:hypothetical protein